MNKLLTNSIFFIAISLMLSCSLVMEENISKVGMIIYTPRDSFSTSNYSVNFKWEPVKNATKYRIQVVSPSFASITRFVIDTVITNTNIYLTMSPGKYEWRIRAENGGTYTEFVKRSFEVFIGDFTAQYVNLKSPTDNYSTTESLIDLKWDTLFSAIEYTILVDTISGDFSSPILRKTLPKGSTSYSLSLNKIGSFKWAVKASDGTNSSLLSERKITCKLIVPQLLAPAKGKTQTRPVSLQWNAIPNVDYLVYIYKSDSITKYDTNTYPYKTSSLNYTFNPSEINSTYFWSIKSIDKKGNMSEESERRKIIVQ